MTLLDWAACVAEEHLAPLGRRWVHVQSVASAAERIAPAVTDQVDALVAAAFLHDIGYSPALATTGFHPLDGARFVRDEGYPELAPLVAHHTGARNEAALRGMPELLQEFAFEDTLLQRALTYCDLTTGPGGQPTNVADRVAEIVERYGAEHVVARAALIGQSEFLEIEAEIEAMIGLRSSRR
jgi:hypothetical protein